MKPRLAQPLYSVILCSLFFMAVSPPLVAGSREQAKRIHDRLAGVPPSATTLDTMAALIDGGDFMAAADIAMTNPAFYNVTLKNFVTPWTNEEQTVFAPLNDYTATVIGMVRDSVPFNQLLSADMIYVGSSNLGVPAYSTTNNDHYQAIEDQRIDLSNSGNLIQASQSTYTGLPAAATAGVLTTRAAARAFFIDGTNRAMFRFTLINHLCNDLEEVKDTTRPPDRIRQDVSRSPGGDSRIFLNACVGCHSGMDPMAQAFAYYNYQYDVASDPAAESGQLIYNNAGTTDPATGTRVMAKYHINSKNFEYGYITPNDHWDNYWRHGPNAALGWDQNLTGSGDGAKTLGQELANSQAFAHCQVKKVFQAVCLRAPVDSADRLQIDTITSSFKNSSYNLKHVFAETALYCKGD